MKKSETEPTCEQCKAGECDKPKSRAERLQIEFFLDAYGGAGPYLSAMERNDAIRGAIRCRDGWREARAERDMMRATAEMVLAASASGNPKRVAKALRALRVAIEWRAKA